MRSESHKTRTILLKLIAEIRPYETLNEHSALLDEGILDSLGIMALMTLIEDHFELHIPDLFVKRENFESVIAIEQMLHLIQANKKDCS